MATEIETALTFACSGETLIGVLHRPPVTATTGVVVVVGGPQYRVGSHRQFVLLARALAAQGLAVLRFDCRGMGDSEGVFPGFEDIEPDVAAAVEAMLTAVPSLEQVVLWGLCDATTAITEHARRNRRVAGVVLVNPWVRDEKSLARAQLKHYYFDRLLQRDFLRKVMQGKFNPFVSARSLFANLARAMGLVDRSADSLAHSPGNRLAEQMADNLQRFTGHVLIILSGKDLTANEFTDAAHSSRAWQKLYRQDRVRRRELPEADHTFSRRSWCDLVADWTAEWVSERVSARAPRNSTAEAESIHSGKSASV